MWGRAVVTAPGPCYYTRSSRLCLNWTRVPLTVLSARALAGPGCWDGAWLGLTLSEESCRVSLNTAELHTGTGQSLHRGGYPPTCRITLPFTLRVPLAPRLYFYCQRSDVPLSPCVSWLQLRGFSGSDVTAGPDQLTGATQRPPAQDNNGKQTTTENTRVTGTSDDQGMYWTTR